MDLNALKSQLDTTEGQLGQYTANLPSEIETQIQGAYTPLLERSLGVTKDLMGDYLGRFMETTDMGPGMQGTTAYDLSPTQRMGVIGRELGDMGGQLNSSVAYSDYLGGQMNDMYQKALGAAQMGQQNLADQYNRQFQLYQLAWQEAQAEKDRANALAAARLQMTGYGDSGNGGGGGGDDTTPQELKIEVPDPIDTKRVLSGGGGGVVTKTSGTKPLVGGILPNTGGQTINLSNQYGLPTTNKLTGTSDLLFRKLLGL